MADARLVALAREGCDTLMRKFEAEKLPPEAHFHYHQGVFLAGVLETWRLTGDEKYLLYVKRWVDSLINPFGNLTYTFNPGQLDDLQPGVLLFTLYEQFHDKRYRIALDTICRAVKAFPRTEAGGFWHKYWYRNQMWLDGLYMAGPFLAMYAQTFGEEELFDECVFQAEEMYRRTADERTGLWYHAWDADHQLPWADPETGRSREFWGRSIGWVPVALLLEVRCMPAGDPRRDRLKKLAVDLLGALLPYQAESGMWYQVVDKGDDPANWQETSCTCLYTAALAMAVREGWMDADACLPAIRKGLDAVILPLKRDENGILLDNVCVGTSVGVYDFYIARPTSTNDLHGMGAYLLMCTEAARTFGELGIAY